MKVKHAIVGPWRWSTPVGTIEENVPVDDGILIEARVWVGAFNITLIVQCAEGRDYRALRALSREAHLCVLDFLRRNKGRTLRDVIDREMDFPETVH
jgi:hypothetical protein